jgi:tetratricopeptide (TPR) repeat protein
MINKLAYSFFILICMATPAAAGGMAVADAVSHMYESMNLEKTIQQLETGLQQLEFVQKSTETLEKAYEKAHTNYKRAKGVYDDLVAVKAFYDKTTTSWMGRYEKYRAFYNDVSDPDKAIEDFKGLLDEAFVDPRSIDPDDWKKLMDRQFDMRQLALKELLDKTEATTKGIEGRVEKAQNLAKDIDGTTSEKDAMDLNNRLLLEILLVLQDMLAVDAQYQQAMGALKYEGVTEESIKARQETLKNMETDFSKYRFEVQVVEQLGISDDDTIMDTIQKTMDKGI